MTRKELLQKIESGEADPLKASHVLRTLDRTLDGSFDVDDSDETGDPLFDQWERDLAEGRMPDLDLGDPHAK